MQGSLRVGDWIGDRFEIFDVHEGGMSWVYVVHDHRAASGRAVVALKTLRDDLLRNRIRRTRFATECRLWVQLGRHPNIVQAHAVEILDGRPYVMLELVQGGDLIRWIGTSRLDLPRALRFGIQFCQGMEHAGRQGLSCHRDIKPGNLMVAEDGTLKITDFGLARICEEMVAGQAALPDGSIPLAAAPQSPQPILFSDPRDEAPRAAPAHATPAGERSPRVGTTQDQSTGEYALEPEESENPRLTRIGARLGTGAYMAPEQFADAASADVRADIYAFGVVLFEMIAGRLPFSGRSIEMLARQHTRYQPPSLVPSLARPYARMAPAVDAAVQRCLRKDPAERFQTMPELRKALQALLARARGK
ncbi:Serine/threonine-protein kinase PknD [Aquisphaera giovannonii]|uniref:Serine/threonine-protein kinase PknD n=1 Tax=Aquisphaera giovannonii TaxID=406548 RepID=A0A5B9W5G7_9BACT|nr:serine/threonine-protein kinase [Aquisphaera giovannonii]QEH35843.1 Serine/threonine-protein kinase PknD [Aquisphaera giovannonii]